MLIKVTEDDIKNGKPKDAAECPIALAFMRQVNFIGIISVDCNELVYYSDDIEYTAEMPNNAHDFIINFDGKDVEVKPFEFEIELLQNRDDED